MLLQTAFHSSSSLAVLLVSLYISSPSFSHHPLWPLSPYGHCVLEGRKIENVKAFHICHVYKKINETDLKFIMQGSLNS